MPQELLFELDDVRITPYVATFGGTSYQIASIGSVRVLPRRKRNPVAILVFLLGVGMLIAAIAGSRTTGMAEDYFSMAASSVAVMAAAFLLQLVWPRWLYGLILRTASGDVEALSSRNEEFVANVRQALEQAFVARARHAADAP
jgi:hypothetical protein